MTVPGSVSATLRKAKVASKSQCAAPHGEMEPVTRGLPTDPRPEPRAMPHTTQAQLPTDDMHITVTRENRTWDGP